MGKIERQQGYRSLFWPVILIGIGTIWLLGNLGIISGENLSVLGRIWPLLLIIVGLDILLGRNSPVMGGLLGVGAVVLVVVLILIGPSLGLAGGWSFTLGPFATVSDADIQTETFTEALNDATSLAVTIDMPFEHLNITALEDTNGLIEADIDYIGDLTFDVSGDRDRRVRLNENTSGRAYVGSQELTWDVALSPDVPLDLALDVSSGAVNADLTALQLSNLDVGVSSGSVTIDIPENTSFDFRKVGVSSGTVQVNVGENAAFTVDVEVSSGAVTFDVPDEAAVQVNVDRISSGSVNVPGQYERVSGQEREEGTWQSEGFATVDARIVLNIEVSSGVVTVR